MCPTLNIVDTVLMVEQVAQRLNVNEESVRRWLQPAELRSVTVGRRVHKHCYYVTSREMDNIQNQLAEQA
jgi:excisionase family DNA binding protein